MSVPLLAAACSTVAFMIPARAASPAPAYPGDFPDPTVLAVGPVYWAYATGAGGRNLQVMSSTDLHTWVGLADPLPVLPSWAQPGYTWAPGVVERGGQFLLYYTARQASTGRQCVSVATSSAPGGPFTDRSSRPMLCQLVRGGSIDPSPFVTSDGALYLLWKSEDNAVGQPTHLWSQRLAAGGTSLIGSPVLLLTQTEAWQGPVIEGPSMFASGGLYYLFYGANRWDTASAAIGYAVCRSPLGPCTNASVAGPWMGSYGPVVGPSGPSLFRDAFGTVRLAYHGWTRGVGYGHGGVRSLWIDTVTFAGQRPRAS